MNRTLRTTVALGVSAALSVGLALSASAEPIGEINQITNWIEADGGNCYGPSVGSNPLNGQMLSAYGTPDDTLEVALIDAAGLLSSTPVEATDDFPFADCKGIEIAATPEGGFLVMFWSSTLNGLVGQFVNADGALVGENFEISTGEGYSSAEGYGVAYNPISEKYLAVASIRGVDTEFPTAANSQQWVGTYFDATGAVLSDDFLITDVASGMNDSMSLAYGNGIWVAAGKKGGSPAYAVLNVLDSDGPVGGLVNVGANNETAIGGSIVYNEFTEQFLVAFASPPSPNRVGRLLDNTGTPIGDNLLISEMGGQRPRLASLGENGYLVTWHNASDGMVYAQQLNADGTLLDPDLLESATLITEGDPAPSNWRPSVAFSAVTGIANIVWAGANADEFDNIYSRAWYVAEPQPIPTPTPTDDPELAATGTDSAAAGSLAAGAALALALGGLTIAAVRRKRA